MSIESTGRDARTDLPRRRLLLGVSGSLVALSPLGLVACGGGGDGDADASSADGGGASDAEVAAIAARLPALAYAGVAVDVALPSGAGVPLAATQLVTPYGVSEVRADGVAGAVTIDKAPQTSYLFDASGRLLAMGVVEAGVRTRVDARTTAEALLLLSGEVELQGPLAAIAMRRALADARYDPVVEPVRRAVEAAAARGGIDPSDADLVAALRTATLTLRAASSRAPATGQAAAKSAHAQAVAVLPSGEQSGVTVEPTEDFATVQAVNRYRRRTRVFVQRTGSFDADGTFKAETPPVPVTDFELKTTTALSFDNVVASLGDQLAAAFADLGFLGVYESGTGVLAPVTSAPVALPFLPADAQVVSHTARVIGVGGSHAGTLSEAEGRAYDAILWETLIEDIAKPFARTLILPMLNERVANTWSQNVQEGAWQLVLAGMTDLSSLAVGGQFFPTTLQALRAGKFQTAIASFATEFFSSNTFQALYESGFRAWMRRANSANLLVLDSNGRPAGVNLLQTPEAQQSRVDALTKALARLTRILQLIKVGTLIGDYAALAHDVLVSDVASEFKLNVSKATIRLTPSPLVVSPRAGAAGVGVVTVSLRGLDASVPADRVFVEWSCTGLYGHLYQRGGTGLDRFESPLANAAQDYIPSGTEDRESVPETITATAFYRNPTTAARVEMGTATVQVQFNKEFNIVVAPQTQDVPTERDVYVTALLQEPLPTGATVVWTWSHTGVGTLGSVPPDANLQNSSVKLSTGASEGTATVTASAVVTVPASGSAAARTIDVPARTARLTVKRGIRTVTVRGSFATDTFTFPNGSGGTGYAVVAFAVVPKVAGFTSCSVQLATSDPYIPKSRSFGPTVYVGRTDAAPVQDRGGAYWLGLSGAGGTIGTDGSGPGGTIAYFQGRFADLVVTATYTLPA